MLDLRHTHTCIYRHIHNRVHYVYMHTFTFVHTIVTRDIYRIFYFPDEEFAKGKQASVQHPYKSVSEELQV